MVRTIHEEDLHTQDVVLGLVGNVHKKYWNLALLILLGVEVQDMAKDRILHEKELRGVNI